MLTAATSLIFIPFASTGSSSAGVGDQAVTGSAASSVNLAPASSLAAGAIPVRLRSSCTARRGVKFYAGRIAYWRSRVGVPTSQSTPPRLARCPRYLAHVLQHKAHAARVAYEKWVAAKRVRFRALYEKWRCIHEHEGAWNANTGNGYYGGLQMTVWFQKTYGGEFYRRWGTANLWPVWAQLEAAERAYQSDGDYGQWGTAPACGLPT